MLATTRAIVLRQTKYGENRMIVTMFTREYGVTVFSAPAGRRKNAAGAGCFRPMSIVEAEFDFRPLAQIQTLRGVRTAVALNDIPFDAYKLSICLFLSEFLRHALGKESADSGLFDYIVSALEWLDSAKGNYANFHIVFMTGFARLTGIEPDTGGWSEGAWFDIEEGCFRAPSAPLRGPAIPPATAAYLPALSRLDFSTMHTLGLSHGTRNALTENLLKYFENHLPDFPEMRSFAVLKQLFGD